MQIASAVELRAKMKDQTVASASENGTVALGAASQAITAAARFLGLNVGDWSTILLGLVVSTLLLAVLI